MKRRNIGKRELKATMKRIKRGLSHMPPPQTDKPRSDE
jgi:hypothetical protein